MFQLSNELQRLIYSYDPTYHDKYDNVLKHFKYNSKYLKEAINEGYFTYNLYYNPACKNELKNRYFGFIKYIKKKSKKLYPPVGSKFWGGLSDTESDSSDSD